MKPHFKLNTDGTRVLLSAPLAKRQAARQRLKDAGISLAEWCRSHDLPYQTAKAVLNGRLLGERGASFRIAVALGLRNGTPEKALTVMPPPRCPMSTRAMVAR